ncbi:tyrosine-type recombinase/integrase [Candidatus Thioglobus sp.]|uniref:tyrosine-type recombinase/integrase n=1 Tax=Candidatus Thioglobus sp. TaxID=2026721 RepID=UPI003D0C2787
MLTDTKIRTSKPKNKLYRLSDSNGLAIEITPTGIKYWRYRYRFNGKASMISLGRFPNIGLKTARLLRDDYRNLLTNDINPSEYKANKANKNKLESDKKITFGKLFYKWHAKNKDNWSDKHSKKVMRQCERHLLVYIKNKSIGTITPQDMIQVFMKMNELGIIETLEKVKGYASRIFKYGVGLGLLPNNPTADLPNDIFKKKKVKNFAHITDMEELAKVLNTIDKFKGTIQVGTALKIAPHVFLRPTELAELLWNEVNFENKQIKIPKGRMKMAFPHIVPLSSQVLALLKQMHRISGDHKYVFPGVANPNDGISPDSLRMALRRLGVGKDVLTTHGLRHTASTQLHEQGFNSDAIERQLSHGDKNKIKATYNHAQYLDERRDMMSKWSDFLDNIKKNYAK